MFLWEWFSGVLNYFGLWTKSKQVYFHGLDNTGKTTLLHVLKDNKLSHHPPTVHPTKFEYIVDGIYFTTYELGGAGHSVRRAWKDYIPAVDAIVFLIDVFDRDRFEESRQELDSLLSDEQIAMAPILVLGNKIDKSGAASEEEIRHVLGLHGQTTGKGNIPLKELQRRPVELFMCSVLKREGYGEGFRWLRQYL